MKCLVTGGAGFIGSNLCEGLLKTGHDVTIMDNFSTGNYKNIAGIEDIDYVYADIRNLRDCFEATKGIDIVFHLAALPSVPRSIKSPIPTNNVNITGTLNMLLASKHNNVKRFIFSSSSSVYGNRSQDVKRECFTPKPISPYAFTKLAGEHYCKLYNDIYNLPTVCLRYFNVFGERQNINSQYSAVLPKFIDKILNNQSPIIFGDGKQSRDFTYVSNVVEANILASTNCDAVGKTFNIACGNSIEVGDMLNNIREVVYHEKPELIKTNVIYESPRIGDIKRSLADISQAKKILGYYPNIGFEEGLLKTVKWYLSNK